MTTLQEIAYTVTPVEDTHGYAFIEWADCRPLIVWTEPLRFHYARTVKLGEWRDVEDIQEWWPDTLSDKLLKLMPPQYDCYVDSSGEDDGEVSYPILEIGVFLKKDNGKLDPEMSSAAAFDMLWPAIATLFNITDLGTFNSPYLFAYPTYA